MEFVVFKDEDDCQPLLDMGTSTQMSLVEIKQQNFYCVAAVPRPANERKQIGLHLRPRKITSGHGRK